MGQKVGTILAEWQIAMHNATIEEMRKRQVPPPRPPADEPGKKPEEVKAEKAQDMHIVQDLVEDIAEKPE